MLQGQDSRVSEIVGTLQLFLKTSDTRETIETSRPRRLFKPSNSSQSNDFSDFYVVILLELVSPAKLVKLAILLGFIGISLSAI